jgi:outer membrane protein assembly factor BamB
MVQPLWSAFVGRVFVSPAIGADGTVYVAGIGYFSALTPDGTLKWQYRLGNDSSGSAPVVAGNGLIYFASASGKLAAFKTDGAKVWEYQTGALLFDSPAVGDDGTIYVGNESGAFFALSPAGALKWRIETEGPISSSAAIAPDGALYMGSGTNVIAVSSKGDRLWSFHTKGKVDSSPAIAADETILIGSADGKLYALQTDGAKKWEFATGGEVRSSPVLASDGTIYIGTVGAKKADSLAYAGKLFALSPDGIKRWEFAAQDAVSSPAAVADDGTIYVGANDARFYAVNADGSEKWEFQADGPINSGATIGADGRVYVGSINSLFAFPGSSGPARSSWPMFRRDARNHARVDTGIPPSISINLPADGAYFPAGEQVRISADISAPNQPVAGVEFLADSQLISSVTTPPFFAAWSTTVLGGHELTARTVDALGHVTGSSAITVWVYAPIPQAIRVNNFGTNQGILLQGSAAVSSGRLSLTTLGTDQPGAAWLGTKRFVADGFESVFQFQVTNQAGAGGAGFAFVIQNNPSPVLGNSGSGLGYEGIPRSLAIEFDTHQDSFNQDPGFDHIGFHSRRDLPNSADESYAYAVTPPSADDPHGLSDGKLHRIYVRYADHTLSVLIEPHTSWSPGLAIDLDSYLGLQDGEAWIGFTASNSPGAETHDILEWTFGSPNVTPTITSQPQSQTAIEGTSVSFSVAATGAKPLVYQWRFNGTDLPDSTNATLTLNSVTNSGDVSVRVSNARGSALSLPAHLAVKHEGTLRWEFKSNQPIYSSPALDTDGTIYFSADGNGEGPDRLFALLPDGTKRWDLPLGYHPRCAPAIGEDHTIYLGSWDHNLYAVNPDGKILWSYQATEEINTSPAIGTDGTIYFGTDNGRFYALFANGAKRWEFASGSYIRSSPAIGADGTIYFGSFDQKLYALNPDGTKKWELLTGGEIHSSPALGSDGTIYISSYDDKLYAVRTNGTVRWTAPEGGGDSSPAIGSDGTIYIGRGWNLSAFSSSGTRKWTFPAGDRILAGPAIAKDGTIYFGSLDGTFSALSAAGTKLWSVNTGASIGESAPAIGPDGVIYTGTYDGRLLAFNGTAPLADTPWPMFRRDLARRGRVPSLAPPVVTLEPLSGSYNAGTNILLSVRAIGQTPISYQWLFDGTPLTDGDTLQGARSPDLSLVDVQPSQSGLYSVQITNARGTVISAEAAINIVPGFRPTGTKIWEFKASAEIVTPAAVGPRGSIYFGTADSKVVALTPSGVTAWTYDAGSRPSPAAIALDGTIYFGTGWPSNQFLALSPDGQKQWSVDLPGGVDTSASIGFDGTIYFTTKDGKLHAVHPDGSPSWEATISDGVYQSAPAIAVDGTVYVGAGKLDAGQLNAGDFYSFYPEGTMKWHFTARGPFLATPSIGPTGNVYFGSSDNDGLFYAFDRQGHLLWQFRSGASINFPAVVNTDDSVYFGLERNVFALDSTGLQRWFTPGTGTGALLGNGSLCVTVEDGRVRAVSSGGLEEWSTVVGDWGTPMPPIVSDDGTIYVTRGDKLAAIQGAGGPPVNSWPMFQHDARHSGNLQHKSFPRAIITQPPDRQHFRRGEPISIAARAFSGTGAISSIQYWVDGRFLGSTTTAPYEFIWKDALPGPHRLIAVATDSQRAINESGEISLVVNDPPAVQLVEPGTKSIFLNRDDVTLVANTSDPDGFVVRVDFLEGDRVLATVTNPPFGFVWERVAAGTYHLSARAVDDQGDTNVSPVTVVKVDAYPAIELIEPVDGSRLNTDDPLVLHAAPVDSDGTVTRVQFFDGAQLLGETVAEPHLLTVPNFSLGEHALFARVLDDWGASSRSRPITVTVTNQNTAPLVTFLAPINRQIFTAPAVVPIEVRAKDSDGVIASVEISVNGLILPSTTTGGSTRATWSNVPAGEFVLTARATDRAGAEAVRSRNITVLASNQTLPNLLLPNSQPRTNFWTPDGPVHTMLEHNGVLYIGGAFDHIGQYVPGHALVDLTARAPDLSFPSVDGAVDTIIGDGSGGYFIGGFFNSVGTFPCRGIAHIKADKSLDPSFRADANGHVITLCLVGDVLYAGGEFSEIAGRNQRYIAALDRKTGALKPWNPEPTGWVSAILVKDRTVYLGGDFHYVGGKYRDCIAAVDIETALALPWNPGADHWVLQMLLAGDQLYVAGRFKSIANQVRNGLASFDLTSGALDSFNAEARAGTHSLEWHEGVLWIGGDYGAVGINVTNTIATVPALSIDGSVESMAVSGDYLYLAGTFTQVNGVPRNKVAAVDRFTGEVTALDLNPSGRFVLLGKSGQKVLGAGSLGLIQVARKGLAAIDIATGFATSWDAKCDGEIFALAGTNDTLYVGGTFYSLDGQPRDYLGAVSFSTAKPTSWRPRAVSSVRTLGLTEESIFVGGGFTKINDEIRWYAAELDLRTGDPTDWNVKLDGLVSVMRVTGDTVYLGGDFTRVGSETRNRLAAVNRYTGRVAAWNPNPDGLVRSIAVSDDVIYVGGGFHQIGGAARSFLAGLDRATGDATAWSADTDSGILALEKVGDVLYAGGQFKRIGGVPRVNATALSTRLAAPNALEWDPRPGETSTSTIQSVAVTDSGVFLGGAFTDVGGLPIRYLAAFDPPTHLSTPLSLPNNLFHFDFFGPLGYYYIFEYSSDLANWTPVFTNKPPFIYEDIKPFEVSRRFYRARAIR